MRFLTPEEAARVLSRGGVILLPTSTLWGVSADPLSKSARSRVLSIKQRSDPRFVHLAASLEMALNYGRFTSCALSLARRFWPGPLTLIVGATEKGKAMASKEGTVALRVDPHPTALEVVRLFGRPILSTSANLHGDAPPGTLEEVSAVILNVVDGVIEGPSPQGIPSTIVDCSGQRPLVLRQGVLDLREDELCS